MKYTELKKRIFQIETQKQFNQLAIEIFNYQSVKNPVYKNYVDYLNINRSKIHSIYQIPFLPIEFFKTKQIITNNNNLGLSSFKKFKSSGTTGSKRSIHYVQDIEIYRKSFFRSFEKFFGNIEDYIIVALLPSYIQAGESSLVYMCENLIKASKNEKSGFYLSELEKITNILSELNKQKQKVILFGVSYALLDLSEITTNTSFDNLLIVETGGMKGRRKELIREELHSILKKSFKLEHVYSEYGMTELLSQAYLKEDGLFHPAETMQVLIRDINDPFQYLKDEKTGGINIVDLANINSCSFIETKDLGKSKKTGFEVLGRFDNSDIRGCNLLIS